jgi:hypothetical protein
LRHSGWKRLDQAVAGAIARRTGRGSRLDKGEAAATIDAAVSLPMACERAQFRPEPAQLLGWV